MDDTTSRQQIDELADLYLTDSGQDSAMSHPSPVEGPAPIRLAPKVGDAAASTPQAFADELDTPRLRLTEEEQAELNPQEELSQFIDKTPGNETPPRAVLEAVLMGNLPGMSGPWLTQYAQLLAQTEGPVILLHIGEEAIDLELVEPRPEALPAPSQPSATVRIPPMRGDRTGLVGLIDALIRSEQTPARTILVRFDSTADARSLSQLAAMDDWTILCGSDSASIAAASQQLRNAVHTDPRLADRHVGIMVMGSDDDAAQAAAKRIASELEHDLANPVELVGHLKRMQPVQVRDLGSFPDPVAIWPKLVSFFDSLEMPEPLATPEPAPKPKAPAAPPTPRAATGPTQTAAASRPEPSPRFRQAPPSRSSSIAGGMRTPGERTTVAAQPTTTPASGARRSPATSQQVSQKMSDTVSALGTPTRPAPTPRVLSPQPELDLIALLAQGAAALDSPVALEARIPNQSDTQLAVDAHGTVHLLKKGSGVISEDCLKLIEAGQWVADHLELIALTQRDQKFVDTAPVLHLLTDQAGQLIGKTPGQIKLHLLQQVTLGKETGWFCTPLN